MTINMKPIPCGHNSNVEKLALVVSNIFYLMASMRMKDKIGKYLLFFVFIASSIFHGYSCRVKKVDDTIVKLQKADWVISCTTILYFLIKYRMTKDILMLIIPSVIIFVITCFTDEHYPILHTLWHIGGGLVALKITEQNSK